MYSAVFVRGKTSFVIGIVFNEYNQKADPLEIRAYESISSCWNSTLTLIKRQVVQRLSWNVIRVHRVCFRNSRRFCEPTNDHGINYTWNTLHDYSSQNIRTQDRSKQVCCCFETIVKSARA